MMASPVKNKATRLSGRPSEQAALRRGSGSGGAVGHAALCSITPHHTIKNDKCPN